MRKTSDFIGICMVFSAVVLAAAIYLQGRNGRFQLQGLVPPGTLLVSDTRTGSVNTIQFKVTPVQPAASALPPGGTPGVTSPDLGGKKSGEAKAPAGETTKELPKATK